MLWSVIFIPQCCHLILIARTMLTLARSIGRRCCPPLRGPLRRIPRRACGPSSCTGEALRYVLLRQPVAARIVACRAALDAKSRPADRQSRRSKDSDDPCAGPAAVRHPKCFRFDICAAGIGARRPGAGALPGRFEKFSRDFPEPATPFIRRVFDAVPKQRQTRNVSSEKHELRGDRLL